MRPSISRISIDAYKSRFGKDICMWYLIEKDKSVHSMHDVWDFLVKNDYTGMLATLAGQNAKYGDNVSKETEDAFRLLACKQIKTVPYKDKRTVWELFKDKRLFEAVETAERYALGEASDKELKAACHASCEYIDALNKTIKVEPGGKISATFCSGSTSTKVYYRENDSENDRIKEEIEIANIAATVSSSDIFTYSSRILGYGDKEHSLIAKMPNPFRKVDMSIEALKRTPINEYLEIINPKFGPDNEVEMFLEFAAKYSSMHALWDALASGKGEPYWFIWLATHINIIPREVLILNAIRIIKFYLVDGKQSVIDLIKDRPSYGALLGAFAHSRGNITDLELKEHHENAVKYGCTFPQWDEKNKITPIPLQPFKEDKATFFL